MERKWMAGVRLRMALEQGHGAGVTGTTPRRRHEHGNHVGREEPTHIDSADPFCLFISSECSPFPTYGWFFAGAWSIRARHSVCRPKDGKGDKKKSEEKHRSAGGCAGVIEDTQ